MPPKLKKDGSPRADPWTKKYYEAAVAECKAKEDGSSKNWMRYASRLKKIDEAKQRCMAKEGNDTNWMNYLDQVAESKTAHRSECAGRPEPECKPPTCSWRVRKATGKGYCTKSSGTLRELTPLKSRAGTTSQRTQSARQPSQRAQSARQHKQSADADAAGEY